MKVKTISNKVIATVLCALMLVSSIVVSGVVSSANIADVWDGETLTAPTVGSGSETEPFEISIAEELAYALNAFGKDANGEPAHYKLTADIYLNDTSSADWLSDTATKNPWFSGKDKNGYYNLGGSESGAFVGSIDGNGHMVYGLWYPEATGSFASGLVPVFSGSYIRNLGVDKAYIISDIDTTATEGGAGAIAGITKGSLMSIDSCFSGADVTVKSKNGASGIVGSVRNGADQKLTISNCYSLIPNANLTTNSYTADTTGSAKANGIIGDTYKSYFSVTNSYSIAKPYCFRSKNYAPQNCLNEAKTAVSSAIITEFANVYSASEVTRAWNSNFDTFGTYTDEETGSSYTVATKLSAEEMQGENALSNMLLGDKFVATDTYPALKVFVPQSSDTDTNSWGGDLAEPELGEGTAETPYEISTAAQLAYALNEFGKKADGTAAHYKLTADIYLNDVTSDSWISNSNNKWFEGKDENGYYTLDKSAWGAFVGSIDGNGHMVYGLWYPEATGSFASGLVPVFSGSYIKNLGVDKAYIVTDLSSTDTEIGAGAIAGITKGSLMSIDSCFSGAEVTVKSMNSASGIVGAVRNTSAGTKLTISNCYSLIPNANLIMGDNAADSTEGNKANGIIGDTWKSYFSVTNSYSIAKPYCLKSKNNLSQDCLNDAKTAASSAIITNFANVYSQSSVTKAWGGKFPTWGTYTDGDGVEHYVAVQLSASQMQGKNALNNMLLGDRFVATSSYPVLVPFYNGDDSDDEEDNGGSGGELEPPVDEDLGPVWNGKVATQFAEGSGTEDDPYKITKGSELALAITMGMGANKYYSVENDIYLNEVTDKYWYENNENNNPWVSDDVKFKGYIDGNGYIIYGIYYPDDTENKYSGLIPQMSGGSIEGLGIRSAFVNATDYAAGLVGGAASGNSINIESCFADETVLVNYTGTGNGGVAGIVGYSNNGSDPLTINNCYSKAVVTGADTTYRTNGIIGTAWKAKFSIKNSYSANTAPFAANGKNAVSSAYMPDGVTVSTPIEQIYVNVYSDGRQAGTWEHWSYISDSQSMRGELAKTSMPALDYKNVWQTVEGGTPKLRIFKSITGKDVDSSKDPENYASGSGTKDDPYIIKTADQLEYLVRSEITKGKYYALGCDIYVNNTKDKNWLKKNPREWLTTADTGALFSGYIDGRGHFVYGLYVNDTPDPSTTKMNGSGTGLFPAVSTSAVIRNIHIRSSQLSGEGYVGSVVGKVSGSTGYAEITACSADTSVTLKGQTVGGLVGGGNKRGVFMTYSYFTGKIALATGSGEKDHRGNGLIGDMWGSDHIAAECYSVGYQNYRKKAYQPYLSNAIYGTVSLGTTITLTPEQMKGANAKKNMTELNWDLWTVKDGGYPHISVLPASYSYKFFDNGTKGEVWSGYVAEDYASGTGTKTDPYIIETAEQMAKLVIDKNTLGNYYKLACDLYINDVSKANWKENAKTWMVASNHFRGYFDGDGHVVYGLYYDTEGAYAGLFTGLGPNGVIEKVGVSEAYILNCGDETNQAYSGGLVANIGSWQSKGEPTDESYERPIIRQCFVDDTVYIESHYAGGLVGGAGSGILLENCYFTGEITGYTDTARLGTLIGNAWSSKNYSIIVNCYTADADGLIPVISSNAAKTAQYTNTYIDGVITKGTSAKKMNLIFMHGQNCKEYMLGFDFSKIWKPVTDGSPVLRCFASAEKFSCKRAPKKVEISFATEGGEELEPIYGYPRFTAITELPVPTRYGYEFGGWYVNKYKAIPFELTAFPDYDMVLYAVWNKYSFDNGFESTIDEQYDINAGIEIYRPGVAGYNPKFIHGGMRNLHTLPEAEVDPTFLINYEYPLEIGKEYEISFWMYVKEGTDGDVVFLHANYPQVDSPTVGYQEVAKVSETAAGQWVEIKATVVANAPYILVRTDKGSEIYFDDFQIVPTGNEGKLGELEGYDPDAIGAEPFAGLGLVWIIVIIAVGVVLLGAIATVVIILVKKKKKA